MGTEMLNGRERIYIGRSHDRGTGEDAAGTSVRSGRGH